MAWRASSLLWREERMLMVVSVVKDRLLYRVVLGLCLQLGLRYCYWTMGWCS